MRGHIIGETKWLINVLMMNIKLTQVLREFIICLQNFILYFNISKTISNGLAFLVFFFGNFSEVVIYSESGLLRLQNFQIKEYSKACYISKSILKGIKAGGVTGTRSNFNYSLTLDLYAVQKVI